MVLGHDIQTELDGQMTVGREPGETAKLPSCQGVTRVTLALFVTITIKYIVCAPTLQSCSSYRFRKNHIYCMWDYDNLHRIPGCCVPVPSALKMGGAVEMAHGVPYP